MRQSAGLAAAALLAAAAEAAAQEEDAVLVTNVNVVDVASGTVAEGQSILIDDGTIAAVGPTSGWPKARRQTTKKYQQEYAAVVAPAPPAEYTPWLRRPGRTTSRCQEQTSAGRNAMNPDLEVVQIGSGQSFKAWEHGYPFHTVRWHFHPELELHYVVETTGRYFVGDFIGSFKPGNLVLAGPNLPHNWVSDTAPNESVALRSRVVQFTEGFAAGAIALMPELAPFRTLLERSRRGLLFGAATSERVDPLLERLNRAQGIHRIALFWDVIHALTEAQDVQELTSAEYLPDPSGFMSLGINQALAYLNENLTQPVRESDLARIAGLSPSAFSRSFRRHTGLTLVQFITRLRINFACQMMMNDEALQDHRCLLLVGFQQSVELQPAVPATEGHDPLAVQVAPGRQLRLRRRPGSPQATAASQRGAARNS